jgi:AcrR family transcriptional regulator
MRKRTYKNTTTTRNQILEAYVKLCAEKGITNVTLQKVAKEAKLAFATVRYHFAERSESLEFEAALYVLRGGQITTQNFIDQARKQKDFNGIVAYLEATFMWLETKPLHTKYMIYFYYLSSTKQDVPLKNESVVDTARLRVASLIHEAIGRKVIRYVDNVEELAAKIYTIVFGGAILAMSIGTKDEFRRQKKNAIACIFDVIKAAEK